MLALLPHASSVNVNLHLRGHIVLKILYTLSGRAALFIASSHSSDALHWLLKKFFVVFFTHYSELERNACHFFVLLLGEFVFERGQELRVHFQSEALDFLYDGLQVLISVS